MDSGNLDGSTTAVNEYYTSPFYINKHPQVVSKTQKNTLYFSPTSSGTLYYSDRINFNSAFFPNRERFILSDTTNVVQVDKTVDIPLTQNVYQFKLTSSASTANPWKLNHVDLSMSQLGIGKS
jgi:hypothetical protein